MKRIFTLLIFMLLLATRMYAQQNPEIQALEQRVERYGRMKNGGGVLTVLGGICMIAGVVTVRQNPPDIWADNSGNFAGGMALFMVGAAGVGAGIPLAAVGTKRERSARKALEEARTRLTVDVRPRGVGLTLRF